MGQTGEFAASSLIVRQVARQIGIGEPPAKKGIFDRFLEKLAKENEKSFGGKPPTCH